MLVKFKFFILFTAIAGFLFQAPQSAKAQIEFAEIESESQWDELLDQAGEEDKLVFLDIYATWCGPCKYLDNNVFSDSTLGVLYNRLFLNAKLDGESEFGRKMVTRLELQGYPTMFYLNSDMDVLNRIVGVREADPLGDIGKNISNNAIELLRYAEAHEKGNLETDGLIKYQTLLTETGNEGRANEISAEILPSLSREDILNPEYKEIIIQSAPGLDSEVFAVVKENIDRLEETWGQESMVELFQNMFNASLGRAVETQDEVLLDSIINVFLPVYMRDNPQELQNATYATKKLYLANTKAWGRFNEVVMNEYEEKYQGEDKFLYNEAYQIINNYNRSPEALNRASGFMEKALELNKDFQNLILMAYVEGMREQFESASTYLEEATQMEMNEEQQALVEELRGMIQQSKE